MRIQYDKAADAMHIRFSDSSYAESEEIQDGVIFDRDADGVLIGIELLNVSTRMPSIDEDEFSYEVSDENE